MIMMTPQAASFQSPTSVLSDYLSSTYGALDIQGIKQNCQTTNLLEDDGDEERHDESNNNNNKNNKVYEDQITNLQRQLEDAETKNKSLEKQINEMEHILADTEKETQRQVQALEERAQAAEQEMVRKAALALVYQDDIRRLELRLQENSMQDRDDFAKDLQADLRALKAVRKVTKERDSLVALKEMSKEKETLQEMAIKEEKAVVALEIDKQMLESASSRMGKRVSTVEGRSEELEAKNVELESTLRIFRQRLVVAERERQELRTRELQKDHPVHHHSSTKSHQGKKGNNVRWMDNETASIKRENHVQTTETGRVEQVMERQSFFVAQKSEVSDDDLLSLEADTINSLSS